MVSTHEDIVSNTLIARNNRFISKTDSNTGRHREHPWMLAAVGGEEVTVRWKGPADFRLHKEAEVPGGIELEAAGAEQP